MPSRATALAIATVVLASPAVAQKDDLCAPFKGVSPRVTCGILTVPEDRSAKAAAGRTIPIRYVVVRAVRPAGKEAVILFSGGPGAGSTEMVDLATGPFAPIGETRDVLLIDQRGTGGSNMLGCPVDLVTKPALAFGHVFDPAVFVACRKELERRADLRFYTTDRAIEDIDQVRATLGYDRVLVWGGSYGTRMAQAYARRYPTRTAAVVLDGVVPFDFHAPSGYAASLQQSVDRVIADCRADPTCHAANPDPGGALSRIATKLAARPVATTIRRRDGSTAEVTMSLGDFGYAVRGLLYRANGARRIPALLTAADQSGDLSPFAQAYWQRAADFNADFADGLHFSVLCAEDIQAIREPAVAGLVKGAFIGRYLIDEYVTVCRDWVTAPLEPGFETPLRIDAPVLIISGWFDPVTPPQTGDRVAAALPNTRHLLIRNEAHGAGAGCALPATLHVLTKATLEGLPPVCAGVTNLFTSGRRGG